LTDKERGLLFFMRIYTLGTSNREPYQFTKILSKYQLKVIFDVRRFPTSKFLHFKRENLQKLCESEGVEYVYLGNELGGYRRKGYKEHMKTQEFKRGLEIVKKAARSRAICILCAERFPLRCHRKFIAEELTKEGFEVIHILDENRVWQPK